MFPNPFLFSLNAQSSQHAKQLEELYNDVEITVKDRELNILNRKVYVKEVIPRGYWNTESKTENGKPRLTVVLYHDREKRGVDNPMNICCSDLWYKMQTIAVIAQHGHRVIAVDLPGYGQSDTCAGNEIGI